MILAPRLRHANDNLPVPRALAALVMALTGLFAAVAIIAFLGASPVASQAPTAGPVDQALPKGECATALARALASESLPSDQAIAASTAMLRACKVG